MSFLELFQAQSHYFATGITKQLSWRRQQLQQLKTLLTRHTDELLCCLQKDMGKPPVEAYSSEIALVIADADAARKNLQEWSKPKRVHSPLVSIFSQSQYYPVPFGTALIIGPWNYPIGLLLQPLVAALAAGNCAVLKPSEFAPACSSTIANCIKLYFEERAVAVCQGEATETAHAIEIGAPDFVFFTGGTSAGKSVMSSCAKELIPVTLELGGCNPCIVEPDIPVNIAARRIVWTKFFNAGQTCVAPNTCYVHTAIYRKFKCAIVSAIQQFYGEGDPEQSDSYARVINSKHFIRLEQSIERSAGKVITGGARNLATLHWVPTVIECFTDMNDPLLTDEIFGPVLTIVEYTSIEDVFRNIAQRPAPLIVYLFTKNKKTESAIRRRTVSGSYCINGSLNMFAFGMLPFGGVGKSGMGRYHGRSGFDTFSYLRSEMKQPYFPEFSIIYPPYRVPFFLFKKLIRMLLK
jgi:acyl-CoA reductase-like NAD-dependent aldehyde dehydrogenase